MTLRVCMLIYHYWPGPEGGTERQCRRLSAALARRGAQCTVLTARPHRQAPARERDGEVSIVRLMTLDGLRRAQRPSSAFAASALPGRASTALPPSAAASFAARLIAWLNALLFQASATVHLLRRARSYDVIHVHTNEWIAGFAVWLGRRAGLPILCKVATLPAFPATTVRVPFGRAWERLRTRASFVALNGAMVSELRTAGIPSERIREIPNSVELPEAGGRREEPSLVLYVGNLSQHAYKAFDVLFEAWARVRAQQPGARLAVLGGGDAGTWERFLEARGCRDSVSFEGFVRDVNAFYARAAVLVLPSRQEGMSNALIEAQGWGVPAVVSDIPANRAVIDDGVNGLVVPVNDAAALAGGLLRLLGDSGLRSALGAQARRRAGERYALDRVVDRTLEAYEHLLRARNGAGATKDAA